MRIRLAVVLVSSMILPAGLAQAAPRGTYVPAPEGMYQRSSPAQVDYNIIYLNGCFNSGDCVITPGVESSINNRSSIIRSTIDLPAYPFGNFDQVVDCVRETYARFNVQIVTEDPGNVPHWENIVAGRPQDAGFQDGVGGVSPFTCGIIDNAITYTFAEVYGGNVDAICWTIAQETAHAWGLDHEFLCADPMTYLTGCGLSKSFQDVDAPCGEFPADGPDPGTTVGDSVGEAPRDCQCGGATQNSVQRILDVFGPAEATPPSVVLTTPQDGQVVGPGFPVRTTIDDPNGVALAELVIDGTVTARITSPPWVFNAPDDLGNGSHTVQVRAEDSLGTVGESAQIAVSIGPGCETSDDCDAGQVCMSGTCVAGPGTDGGLGSACQQNSDCFSDQCGISGDEGYCTEACAANVPCPDGFDCRTGGAATGVCWPASGGGGGASGGCNTSGSTGPITGLLFALAFTFILTRRRETH